LKHQQESIEANREQMKRIESLEHLNSMLLSEIKELEDKHMKTENAAEDSLRKQISKLHSKLTHEARQKEMMHVRKTLHSVLSAI